MTTQTQIINMTPHSINIGEIQHDALVGNPFFVSLLEIPASGNIIRLKVATEYVGEIVKTENYSVRVTKTVFGEPEGLPEYKKNVYYVVSQLVKSALPEREDLLVPAEVQRDSKGVILGCLSLGM